SGSLECFAIFLFLSGVLLQVFVSDDLTVKPVSQAESSTSSPYQPSAGYTEWPDEGPGWQGCRAHTPGGCWRPSEELVTWSRPILSREGWLVGANLACTPLLSVKFPGRDDFHGVEADRGQGQSRRKGPHGHGTRLSGGTQRDMSFASEQRTGQS